MRSGKLERMLRSFLLHVSFLIALLSPAGAQSTHLQFFSQPGDFIGAGTQGLITAGSGWSVTQSYSVGSGVQVNWTGTGGSNWSLHFDNGTDTALQPGTYLYATRWPFNPAGTAGLSVTRNSSGCNTLFGRFVVSEISVSPAGVLTSLAVDFEQHCEGNDAALFGSLRINSSAPSLLTRLINAANVPELYAWTSQPGDFIGGGTSSQVTNATHYFTRSASPTGVVTVNINQPGFTAPWFYTNFDTGTDLPMAPGIYEGAVRYPFNPPGTPGLSVSHTGAGCNTLTGRFVVSEIQAGPGNLLQRLAVDFEQHCEGAIPALFGSIRIKSSVPPKTNLLMGLSFAETFCFGDRCPAGQQEYLGGCTNSSGGGATLTVGGGSNSLAAADLVLLCTGLPAGAEVTLYGAVGVADQPMGRGRLCLGGALTRLAQGRADTEGNIAWLGMAPRLAALGSQSPLVGKTIRLQAVYRDGGSSNLSSGLALPMAP